jgi:hypothetical protein
VKIVDRRKRGHALPSVMTVSPWGDALTRAANCTMDALPLLSLPDGGSKCVRTLIRHSRESGSPDVRENWIPAFRGDEDLVRAGARRLVTMRLLRFACNDRVMCGSTRGAKRTRRVGALHPPALPGQGPRGGWKPPTLHLIRHSRESGSPDARENRIPAFAGMTIRGSFNRPRGSGPRTHSVLRHGHSA